MSRTPRRTAVMASLGVTGVAAVFGAALALPGIAQAVDPTPTPSTSASAAPGTADRESRLAERRAELAAALAKELGIDQAKVAAALEKVQTQLQGEAKTRHLENLKTRLDEAVTAEKLTRAEADAILKAAENGVLNGGGHRGGHGMRGGGFGGPWGR